MKIKPLFDKQATYCNNGHGLNQTLVYKGAGPSTWAFPSVSRPDPVRSVSFRSFRFCPLLKPDGAFRFRPRTVGSTGWTGRILGPRCPPGPGRARGAVAGRGRQIGSSRGCAAGRTPIVKNGNLLITWLRNVLLFIYPTEKRKKPTSLVASIKNFFFFTTQQSANDNRDTQSVGSNPREINAFDRPFSS